MAKYIRTTRLILVGIMFMGFKHQNSLQPPKNIWDYYQALKNKLGIQDKFKIEKKDIANGYLSVFEPQPGIPASKVVTMALWRSRGGKDLIGVFSSFCGGMGCWGKLKDFKIFNANLEEVQKRVLNWQSLKAKMNAPMKEVGNVSKKLIDLNVEIPQKGTSIKIYRGVAGVHRELMATLVYNYNKGTFSIQ